MGWIPMRLISVGLVVATACAGWPMTPDAEINVTTSESSQSIAYATQTGQVVELSNATNELVALLDWAFARFELAQLVEPPVGSITFASAMPGCTGRSGWAEPDLGHVDLTICLPEDKMLRRINGIVVTTPGKLCVLHELSHAWLLQYATDQYQFEFLEHSGLDLWYGSELAWHERGVENAAETLAWGLMDRILPMIRISDPPCESLRQGFRILKGTGPVVRCPPSLSH